MIQVYHGDGKGKTTAAIGLSVRAAGSGKKVCFAQFMKGNCSSEILVLQEIPGLRVLRISREFGFYRQMDEADKAAITKEHNRILAELLEALEGGEAEVIVLDEVVSAYRYGLLDRSSLTKILEAGRGENGAEVILTGRKPAKELLERADYITEMKAVRHPYEKGISARKGIEW